MEAETAIQRHELPAGPERGNAPTRGVGDATELHEQLLDLLGLSDGVAADERTAVDDAVGEKRAPGR